MAAEGSDIDWNNLAIAGGICLVVGAAVGAFLLGPKVVKWKAKREAKKKQVQQQASSK